LDGHYRPWQPCWISDQHQKQKSCIWPSNEHVCQVYPMGISHFLLKPQNRFQPNLAAMFIGWSSTRFVFLVLIWNPTWLPGSIMCSHWLKFFKSSCQ
jgi:hypothetical protein